MYNDSIDILKFTQLHTLDVDRNKTTSFFNVEANELIINLYLNRHIAKCVFCSSTNTVIKETRKKLINHCIIPNKKITIIFHQKKFKCKECNHTFMEFNPIGDGISNLAIAEIINSLRNPRKTFSDVSKERFTSIPTVQSKFDEHVKLDRHILNKVICFDEIYAKKLTKTKYSFLIYDPFKNLIIDVLDARRKNVLENYFLHIPLKERLKVTHINIDMWQTYLNVAEEYLPNATICVDSFHVIEHLNKAMDKIRLKIQKKFIEYKSSNRKDNYWLLKTFHYYLTSNFDNIKYVRKPKSHYGYLVDKFAVLHELLSIDEELKKAYQLKSEYMEFNLVEEYSQESTYKLEDFIDRFKASTYQEFREFGDLLKRWKIYIVNSFIRIDGKRLSNGPMESLNGRIKRIISDGYGYKDFNRFRNRVMFSLNKNEPIK
ncbi:MAG: ISL3 family transposase [Bacilli bacterium]|nr:ISL3 family transposase [Bacilli bacterium]